MFKTFLEETSIHGLKYLALGKNAILKTLWFLCIVASFSTAIGIIYLNVLNWENSPSVVTTVEPVLLQVRIKQRKS